MTEQEHTARRDPAENRYVLHLSAEQMEGVAYVFWLHRMSRSALEANRFTRDYGITHHPDPVAGPSTHRPSRDMTAPPPRRPPGSHDIPGTRFVWDCPDCGAVSPAPSGAVSERSAASRCCSLSGDGRIGPERSGRAGKDSPGQRSQGGRFWWGVNIVHARHKWTMHSRVTAMRATGNTVHVSIPTPARDGQSVGARPVRSPPAHRTDFHGGRQGPRWNGARTIWGTPCPLPLLSPPVVWPPQPSPLVLWSRWRRCRPLRPTTPAPAARRWRSRRCSTTPRGATRAPTGR
ncbi:DUF6417 family protein [Streptomyces sp. NPDC002962]|uniref:DUF6417 family protein n=1 Tax=Streptomyces sp. NPDC002962 TaxID=3364674 RepID=UPI00367B6E4A